MNRHAPNHLEQFKKAMAAFPAGVTIITTYDEQGRPVGGTLSAVTSLSAEPTLMLACFDQRSKTLEELAEKGKPFLIHILADGQQALAMHFAGKSPDKFADIPWQAGMHGLPQLENSAAVLACRVYDLLPGGDHTIVLGEVMQVETDDVQPALVYCQRQMVPALARLAGGA